MITRLTKEETNSRIDYLINYFNFISWVKFIFILIIYLFILKDEKCTCELFAVWGGYHLPVNITAAFCVRNLPTNPALTKSQAQTGNKEVQSHVAVWLQSGTACLEPSWWGIRLSSRTFGSACQRGSPALYWTGTNNTSRCSPCDNDGYSEVWAVTVNTVSM